MFKMQLGNFRFLLGLVATVSLFSCSKEEPANLITPTRPAYSFEVEEAFPGEAGEVAQGSVFGQPMTYSKIHTLAVFQGDILLTQEQLAAQENTIRQGRTEGTGRTLQAYRWPDNIVYYTIDPYLLNQQRVTEAIAHWEAHSYVKFVERTTQPDFVTFRPGSGCSSFVGRVGNRQYINLAPGCTTGNTIHEIGHTLGLWHEQSRVDRDNYIIIHWDNIIGGYERNFLTYAQGGADGFDHGTLDFGSIMMYPTWSFSKNNLPTITKLDNSLFEVQRKELSSGDIAITTVMYPITIRNVREAYNTFVTNGTLTGVGKGKTATNNQKAFSNMLGNAKLLLEQNNIAGACTQLTDAQKRIHTGGKIRPDHFVTGTQANALYNQIKELKEALNCQ